MMGIGASSRLGLRFPGAVPVPKPVQRPGGSAPGYMTPGIAPPSGGSGGGGTTNQSSPWPQDSTQPGYFPGFSPVPGFMGAQGFGGYTPPRGFSPAVYNQGYGVPSFGFGMPSPYQNPYQNPYSGFQNYPRPFGRPSGFNLPMPYGRGGFNPYGSYGSKPARFRGGGSAGSDTGASSAGDFTASQPFSPFPFQMPQTPQRFGPLGPGFSSFLPSFMQNYARPMQTGGGYGGSFNRGRGGFFPPFGGGAHSAGRFNPQPASPYPTSIAFA